MEPAIKLTRKPTLSRPSPSFRLRSSSLNTLRLRRIFDVFDKNGDGEITIDELDQALNRLGLEVERPELDLTMSGYIKPGKQGLEFEDFSALHQALGDRFLEEEEEFAEGQEDSDLTEAFRVFDEDGDGFISAAELQVVLGKLGLPEGREIERVHQMICSVDRNQDGQVDFLEFKHMMQSVSVRGS